jgi:hypothetical protein
MFYPPPELWRQRVEGEVEYGKERDEEVYFLLETCGGVDNQSRSVADLPLGLMALG